ncbi:hypothetical protein [Sphingopyxis lindanitolerans]|uniref:hypothetical protein n=1 Tax=Sphingopyxis lindanitolerans TaxID=2054227 RepID=UPI001864DD74|nr:hypothetical protein [Sphingopyxis lindanitolerans]
MTRKGASFSWLRLLQPQRLTRAEIAQLPATDAGSGTSGTESRRTYVRSGDPSRKGPYTIVLGIPANTRIAAHMHDRVATIVAETWNFSYGMVAAASPSLTPNPRRRPKRVLRKRVP